MSDEGGEAAGGRQPRARTYLINSKRLAADVIGRLAKELGLPVSGSLADTRVMVDGKLTEEHELRNVQVDVIERGPGVRTIKLRDENGMFLEIPAGGELEEERKSGRAEAKSRESSEEEPDGARDDST